MKACFVYITASGAAEARRIARALVEERLAACANVYDSMTSFYWWDDALQEDGEAAIIAKTREGLVPALSERVKALHSYSCPCVVALPVTGGNQAFLDWIDGETRPVQ